MLRQPLKMYLCYVLSLIYEVFLLPALILDLFSFFSFFFQNLNAKINCILMNIDVKSDTISRIDLENL
jgi:hypothetical protein